MKVAKGRLKIKSDPDTADPEPADAAREPDPAPEEDDDQENEEDEDEPMLKYERLGGSVPEILKVDAATAIAASERLIALGTARGQIHILDVHGDEIRLFRSHSDRVNDICINADSSHISSCSDDGTVVIVDLWDQKKDTFTFGSGAKVTALATHPKYPEKDCAVFATAVTGQSLLINSSGFFGHRKTKVPGGEPPIFRIVWAEDSSYVAWATSGGVKVYDYKASAPVAFVPRPKSSAEVDNLVCLSWQSAYVLVIGWGDWVQVVEMKPADLVESTLSVPKTPTGPSGLSPLSPSSSSAASTSSSFSSLAFFPAAASSVLGTGSKVLRSLAKFQIEGYIIAGAAPFAENFVVLAIPTGDNPDDVSDEKDSKEVTDGSAGQHPELLVVAADGDIVSSDALPVSGFKSLTPKDYRLGFAKGASLTASVSAGADSLYYVLSPQDIVVGKVRDVDDHITWLVGRQQYKEALEAAERFKTEVRKHKIEDLAEKYLKHLLFVKNYEEAAAVCQRLLGDNKKLWEVWVLVFAKEGQSKSLAPYVPLSNPKLSDVSYGLILRDFLMTDHDGFLKILRDWPHDLYDKEALIYAVKDRLLYPSARTESLQLALAELLIADQRYVEALDAFLLLKREEEAFEVISKNNLFEAIIDRVSGIMKLNPKRATELLVKNIEKIPVEKVVEQLRKFPELLHLYLHELFKIDPVAGAQFHEIQVELYAQYDPENLLPFFRQSSNYVLEKAYNICEKKKLYKEMVFLLSRMGNTSKALELVVYEMQDVKAAIRLVEEHRDSKLWEELIRKSLRFPLFVAGLLDHVGGGSFVDPKMLIDRIPEDIDIPRIKERLVRIVSDYSLETRLRERTKIILAADLVTMSMRLNAFVKKGLDVDPSNQQCPVCSNPLGSLTSSGSSGRKSRPDLSDLKSDVPDSSRRTLIGDGTDDNAGELKQAANGKGAGESGEILAFYCGHRFHGACIQQAQGSQPQCSICRKSRPKKSKKR